MKEKEFDNLIKSVRQAGKIKRGKMKPSRAFQFDPADIKGIRKSLWNRGGQIFILDILLRIKLLFHVRSFIFVKNKDLTPIQGWE